MKVLNFTSVEILPELLKFFETKGKEGKKQTIRPAWEDLTNKLQKRMGILRVVKQVRKMTAIRQKPPRFKVGEEVKVLWNQRSKYQWFCQKCGKGCEPEITVGCSTCIFKLPEEEAMLKPFNKYLGNVKITEVFKIVMGKEMDGYYLTLEGLPAKWWLRYSKTQPIIKDIQKTDGFKSTEDFFNYFNKCYDLSSPKEFYVYRWKYSL